MQSINSSLKREVTISKRSRTSFSDSPRYLEVRVEDDTLKKVVLHSVATALARRVFPVPGGPTKSTPYREQSCQDCPQRHNTNQRLRPAPSTASECL